MLSQLTSKPGKYNFHYFFQILMWPWKCVKHFAHDCIHARNNNAMFEHSWVENIQFHHSDSDTPVTWHKVKGTEAGMKA